MSVETKAEIELKITQSCRLLRGLVDPATTRSLRAYVEELEARLAQLDRDAPASQPPISDGTPSDN